MQNWITLGCVPTEEDCIQVGDANYLELAKLECGVYLRQLKRRFADMPNGAWFQIKSFPHDFGTYLEVVVKFDDCWSDCAEYVYEMEGRVPAQWDKEAIEELNDLRLPYRKNIVRDWEYSVDK